MEEFGKDKLNRAIGQLKDKKAPELMWNAIEEELDDLYPADSNYEYLQKAIQELPQKKVKSIQFDTIIEASENTKLTTNTVTKRRIKLPLYKIGWAASIALLIASSLYWWPKEAETINIVYTEQKIELAPMLVKFTDLHEQDEVLSFIKANCKAFQQECSQDEFKELLEQYIQLESDRKELMDVINQNQEEKQLVQYLVRLEKKKTELGKKLMQTFI